MLLKIPATRLLGFASNSFAHAETDILAHFSCQNILNSVGLDEEHL